MKRQRSRDDKRRRGAVVVLTAVMLVMLLGFVAFAVDVGYIGMVRTQLQSAADSAALAAAGSSGESEAQIVQTAQEFANANTAAGRQIQLNASDVELGSWDADTRTFTPLPSGQLGTAVKVTVRTSADSGGETGLFFGRIFGVGSVAQEASAVAAVNPRDIAFVVDLSGSMNDDTDPGNSGSSASLIQNVYDDFGFGAYPGESEYAGEQLGIYNTSSWVSTLTKSGGKLRKSYIPIRYRVKSSDSSSVKTWKAYAWVMEVQLGGVASQSGITPIMPNAVPVPNADNSANYNYWKYFIDSYRSQLGYKNYLRMMMGKGRDGKCAGSYTPLSLNSNLCACPMHGEAVGGETFDFPPSEMPTHSCRRALIAALQVIRDRNQSISNVAQKDWVSIIQFDSIGSEAVLLPLTDDYGAAMQVCPSFQAAGSTGTEAGLATAYEHIKPASQGGAGRERSNKVVVLLTDGMPNQKQSSSSTVSDYIGNNPSVWIDPDTQAEVDNWVGGGSYAIEKNAALMQTSMMQGDNWNVYAAGVGGGCDYDFMDRLARMGMTANTDGESPRGTADPTAYEAVLKDIFEKIITNPKLRLVQ
ncbi:MAG: VWA domain-containing protein [Pirellulales bacterium]|nr:VWA domain-containing protein [Pirellulales bacterium]